MPVLSCIYGHRWANSNSKYRQLLMDLERQRLAEKKREQKEKTTLDDALDDLDL